MSTITSDDNLPLVPGPKDTARFVSGPFAHIPPPVIVAVAAFAAYQCAPMLAVHFKANPVPVNADPIGEDHHIALLPPVNDLAPPPAPKPVEPPPVTIVEPPPVSVIKSPMATEPPVAIVPAPLLRAPRKPLPQWPRRVTRLRAPNPDFRAVAQGIGLVARIAGIIGLHGRFGRH
jgi:hypothetical protein